MTHRVFLAFGLVLIAQNGKAETPPDPSALEFFEREVRPLLVGRCQECHGEKKQKGDLRLDSRSAALAGGSTGPAVVPGKAGESLLVDAINYGDLYQMPPKSKLPASEIAVLTRWIDMGAPWPGDARPKATGKEGSFDLGARAKHWSFRPITAPEPPEVRDRAWPKDAIDRFVLAALEARGLAPAPEADRRTLIRRATFDLVGLPPDPAAVDAFLEDEAPDAFEKVVDRLLASPHHGERWGRHWLDLVRYAETAGHEFDYDLPGASGYRDYVIRALNADLPYDRFVVEQVAGDLLDPPRRHPTEGFNESVLGTGFFSLGEGTHSPVDLREEEASRLDNQIDVFSKAFLGLTVACARCHDHKFDAISTKDYYALAGYLQSSRSVQAFIDPPDRVAPLVAELKAIKATIEDLFATTSERGPGDIPESPRAADGSMRFEDFDGSDFRGWFVTGDAFGTGPSRAGDWRPARNASGRIGVSVPSGLAHSGLVSDRLQGTLRSRTFTIEKPYIHYLAAGQGARLNLVVDGFEKIRSPIYGGLTTAVDAAGGTKWHTQDVRMWVGHAAYIEIADGAAVDFTGSRSRHFPGDGFVAVDEIWFSDESTPPAGPLPQAFDPLELDDGTSADGASSSLERYKQVESRIPEPTLALALTDGTARDEPVHIRGSSKTLGDVVPRRFLEAIAGVEQPAPGSGSGRLELARRLVDPANPLTARVLVNRVWKGHFGEGIVRTPDDFGIMGVPPSHPDLLDHLATRFVAEGWSIKGLHRTMMLSSTYRMQSRPVPGSEAERVDPSNVLLHRMNVRRLEAESIRDAILAVSGRLDRTPFGPSVLPHLTPFMDGRGRPGKSGPLDGDGRRSLYVNVRRNFLTPMFLAFDFPAPSSTMGRRNVSNVPAQALTLMNDPFVVQQARLWADRARADSARPRPDAVSGLYLAAFGRPPTDDERAEALAFLNEQGAAYGSPDDPLAWADLCHVLINVKEFIYIN